MGWDGWLACLRDWREIFIPTCWWTIVLVSPYGVHGLRVFESQQTSMFGAYHDPETSALVMFSQNRTRKSEPVGTYRTSP